MKMSVSETAKMFGISVRTLHYYDEIGLLCPAEISESGYKFYDRQSITKLQQIMFFRELEFSLSDIKNILLSPDYDRKQVLQNHRELLLLKKRHIDDLLQIVDETIGGKEMSKLKVTAEDVANAKKKYADEVKKKYGTSDAYKECEEKQKDYSYDKMREITNGMYKIFEEFSQIKDSERSDSNAAKSLAKKLQEYISENYYNCTNEIFKGLSQMYVADERFKENIDKAGKGTAQFVSDAIASYCK